MEQTIYINMLFRLWRKLASVRRRQFVLMLILMMLASSAEVISVGAVVPFLAALTAPDKLFQHSIVQPIVHLLHIESSEQMLLPVTIFFGIAALSAGGIRLLLLWASTRYSYAVGADLSIDVYRRTLYQPYSVHIARNSSEVIAGILGKTAMMTGSVLVPMSTIVSSVILLGGILLALLAVDPVIAISAGSTITLIYWGIHRATRERLVLNSENVARNSSTVLKALQEGLGGIRDVLLDGTQETYCDIFHQADRPLRLAQGQNAFISASPRYAIEALGIIVLVTLAYGIYQRDGTVESAVPVLGALALGAQRILPILQQTYSAFAILRGAEGSLRDMLELLDQPLPAFNGAEQAHLSFERELTLEQLGFRYSIETPWILRNLNLRISKGSRVGFIGASGSGKSTLLDIMMGLLTPTEGKVLVDGITLDDINYRHWQRQIAHVPQGIYLSDSSIRENIAFGVSPEQIDIERVKHCARQAQLDTAIESWPQKYETSVGERGIRLSGGQRQRIGIARALYKQAEVIILDEATSALDNETERSVMEAVDAIDGDRTVLIVAHRLSTLKNCDIIVELADGRIYRIGTYNEIVANN